MPNKNMQLNMGGGGGLKEMKLVGGVDYKTIFIQAKIILNCRSFSQMH